MKIIIGIAHKTILSYATYVGLYYCAVLNCIMLLFTVLLLYIVTIMPGYFTLCCAVQCYYVICDIVMCNFRHVMLHLLCLFNAGEGLRHGCDREPRTQAAC